MSVPGKSGFLLEIAEIYSFVAHGDVSSPTARFVESRFSDLLTRCVSESTALAREFLFYIMKDPSNISHDTIKVIFRVFQEQGYLETNTEIAEIEWLKEQYASRAH